MKVRKLKIYSGSGKDYTHYPQIIIQGKWLRPLGYFIGDKVTVKVEENRLIVEKCEDGHDEEEEVAMVAEPTPKYKPNVIYVKNFMEIENAPLPDKEEDSYECETVVKTENAAVGNHNPRIVKTTIQEFPKSQPNNTDFNETNPINPYPSDVIDRMDRYRDAIRENISYECFLSDRNCQRKELDELVELMVDVMIMPDHASLRIAGAERPAVVVKERFLKLEHSHIAYVLGCLRTNTSKVGNIRSYLLTSLYNAALTIDNYYRAEVNHDIFGVG